ncbi:MAG: heparan-alpha-glucosaminide N-acetyltransferase [Roseobacter sp.]
MQPEMTAACPAPQRILALDLLRSLALLGMVIFHFVHDLEMFGYLAKGTTVTGGWALFASLIAGSFLFMAGFSMSLAHNPEIRWSAFCRRLAIIAAGAFAVTIATYVAFPDRFIFFGILHVIAVSSVLGLFFVKAPNAVILGAAIGAFLLPDIFRTDALNVTFLTWIGLSTQWRPSLDFLPLFPWVSPFLAGICAQRLARRTGLLGKMETYFIPKRNLLQVLAWPGRRSLVIYLIHQPILIGLFWLWTKL